MSASLAAHAAPAPLAPLSASPKSRTRPPRHRPSEPLAPRAGDHVATRFAALAGLVRAEELVVVVDGRAIDAATLARIAEDEARAEAALAEVWQAFQRLYVPHTERAREREGFLRRIVDAIERVPDRRRDAKSRALLRACRLRTPPKTLAVAAASAAHANG